MSGSMYFNPTPEQIAEAQSSTCRMATPKDPRDCENQSTCCYKPADQRVNTQCHNYRPRTDQDAQDKTDNAQMCARGAAFAWLP